MELFSIRIQRTFQLVSTDIGGKKLYHFLFLSARAVDVIQPLQQLRIHSVSLL